MNSELWELVLAYGQGCKALINLATLQRSGDLIKATVRHELVPPATDKRNEKQASRIQFVNEYDIERGLVRVHQLTFFYDDETVSEPLILESPWLPAADGSLAELTCIRKFLKPVKRKSWWPF